MKCQLEEFYNNVQKNTLYWLIINAYCFYTIMKTKSRSRHPEKDYSTIYRTYASSTLRSWYCSIWLTYFQFLRKYLDENQFINCEEIKNDIECFLAFNLKNFTPVEQRFVKYMWLYRVYWLIDLVFINHLWVI